jgi:hypothetical protein
MTKCIIKHGQFVGQATPVITNVQLGWIPNSVELYNATDGTPLQTAYLNWIVPFSSGGTAEILAGALIRGLTSGATAQVQEVLNNTAGTFAAGTAAGFLVLQEGSLTGTFGAENIVITNLASGTIGTDDATVTANVVHNVAVTTAAALVAAGTTAISRYEGATGSASKGFTVGVGLALASKLIRWRAFRDDA